MQSSVYSVCSVVTNPLRDETSAGLVCWSLIVPGAWTRPRFGDWEVGYGCFWDVTAF